MIQHYWVLFLCLFSKYNNKWFAHWYDNDIAFESGSKKYKMMARMVSKEPGYEVQEVYLEKNGKWGPKSIYSMRYERDIVDIERDLGNTYDW